MQKTSSSQSPVASADFVENAEPFASLAMVVIDAERQLTFRDIWKHHRAIIGWSFFWAMCAIGWFMLLSFLLQPRFEADYWIGASMHRSMEQ
jgi:hypothetical protein